MANKVNNSTAQKKWDSLTGSAGVSLSRIVQGKANSSDFQRVQNILSQQSSLASQVFSQALSAAENQAKKFQGSYKAILDKDNKELLSSFEVALNAELQKITPDIVGQLKEIIEMSVLQSNEDLDKSIGSRFEHLKELIPKDKDVPTIHDMLAGNDLLAETIRDDFERSWERHEPDLLAKIANVFEGTLRNLAERINRERAQRAHHGYGGQRALPGPAYKLALPAPVSSERPSILSQGLAMLRGPNEVEGSVSAGANQNGSSHAGTTTSTTVVGLNPAAQRELTTAAHAQTDFYNRVKALLPSPGQNGKGAAEEEGKEEKKADTWWRSFKNWIGGDDDKKKKKSDKLDWIKSLGSMLALMILNPKLFQTIGEGLKHLLTWENLKGAVEQTWDWIKGVSSGVLDAISNLIGGTMKPTNQTDVTNSKQGGNDLSTTKNVQGDKKHADLNHLTPEQKKQFDSFGKANKEGTGGAKGASTGFNSFGADWLNRGLSMVHITTPAMKDFNLAHTDTNANSPTYGHIIVDGKDKGKNPDFKAQSSTTTSSSRSSLNPPLPPTMPAGAGESTTFSESPSVKNTPGISLPLGDPSIPAGGIGAAQPQKGAPQIGIGSFSFAAANSDSLLLMNTTHFTAG